MNLHQIRTMTSQWTWMTVYGGNGRYIGTHLWQLEEGEPPPLTNRPNWATSRYWVPPRYTWQPLDLSRMNVFNDGYTPPLCGHRSQSRFPRAQWGYRHDNVCRTCATIAQHRSIMPVHARDYMETAPRAVALREEYQTWRAANNL